ncbi:MULTISPECIES: MarR family winged helix-turn-helix transcriptional regulator [Hydrogenophaga]|uniref:MarR family winged helix-turn-helix transcriptional regulator n=2 Tax=Hydrogenophaga TaxID=47420 RepID=A0ABW2QK82_9BURK
MARRDPTTMTPPRPAALTSARDAARTAVASPIPDSGIALQAEPGHLIRRAHQLAVSTFHDTHGRQITPVQYAILRALQDTPGIDQVTLADKVALDTSTTADIATRLEAKGWIVRELLPRRQRALSLTPEGEAVLADMLPRVVPMYRQLLAPLAPAEQAEFLHLLRKFVLLNEPAPPNATNDPAADPTSGKPEF